MRRWLAIPLALLVVFLGGPADAQMACGTHASIRAQLDMKYGEVRQGAGLADPVAIFEIWASDEPPYTWTILKITPNGWACVMAVGEGWQVDPPVAPGDPA